MAFTWIPRERNKDADRLANRAMDEGTGQPLGAKATGSSAGSSQLPRRRAAPSNRIVGWTTGAPPTTLLLVRHGVTAFTVEKRFSGVGDPPLIEQGRQEARAAAAELAAGAASIVLFLRRCLDVERLRRSSRRRSGCRSRPTTTCARSTSVLWEGLTFAVVEERWPRELALWLGDTAISPPEGESYVSLRHRVRTAQERIVNRHRSETICVVSHSRPIAIVRGELARRAGEFAVPTARRQREHQRDRLLRRRPGGVAPVQRYIASSLNISLVKSCCRGRRFPRRTRSGRPEQAVNQALTCEYRTRRPSARCNS